MLKGQNMNEIEVINFLKAKVEPLNDRVYGNRYRVSVYLTDGTYLPCVIFQSKKTQIDLAIKRFSDLNKLPEQYRNVVASFAAGGARLASYDIKNVEVSPFAWPLSVLKNIHGETTMAWTAFVVEMNDGKLFSYGTSFRMEFFDLPTSYNFTDIKEIHSGMVYLENEGMQTFTMERSARTHYLHDKPYFTCYLDGLDK